ncbi:helix-turn-helix domain-containing protein [Bailinhaonella thermotolerans]|uniref:Helix-turn-helix domain-containing protein n=1 Tax=Bailinhaonella thermotolerans TaxID=1070861 RepID=A0A3A4B693_9ACTN|nr:pyridoxamine 5'-phosphate oxidase family protein [Bailinhaonella thermotolerans]RJL27082.1 helix-turn-helix domain-containing protein [Bailinhaonella thermotolerans]
MSMGSSGDLGRRVAHRRARLGLTRGELAERAGIAPAYLAYLEERAARPAEPTLRRLADALRTTVGDLLGERTEVPPGPAVHRDPEELGREECLGLISPGGVARVAFAGPHGPTVLPVAYRVLPGAVVFRAVPGVDDALRAVPSLALQVDHIDDSTHAGWTVLIQGPARQEPGDRAPDPGTGPDPAAGSGSGPGPDSGSGLGSGPGPGSGVRFRLTPARVIGHRLHHL